MTQLLEQAISKRSASRCAKLKALSDDEQNSIATMILAEIEEEHHWDQSFASSSDILAQLADEAMTEYQTGQTQVLNPETL